MVKSKLSESQYKECAACAAKPGSPLLCESCLYNRQLAFDLNSLVKYAAHLPDCSRLPLPSALRPCNCGLLDLIGPLSDSEIEKRGNHPEFGPWGKK